MTLSCARRIDKSQRAREQLGFNAFLQELKDKADVVELIQARRLPGNLNVADPVRQPYLETWDALQAENVG